MRFPKPLRLLSGGLVLALVAAAAAVGVARASQTRHPGVAPTSIASLRSLADHYRQVTWSYQRAAHTARTPTSYRYRRSADRAFLRWTIDAWTRRAYAAEQLALGRIHRKLAVDLPAAPALRASLYRRVSYHRRLALALRRIYPGTVTRSFASARARTGRATLRLWQSRSAAAAVSVAQHATRQPELPDWLEQAFLCIHRYEGDWSSNTGNGYYGGLQMDWGFMRRYGAAFVAQWGSADNWPVWAQLEAASNAYASGRGFGPWPNTARACGLL